MYPKWFNNTSARWTCLFTRVSIDQLSVFHCRLVSNLCTFFIENSESNVQNTFIPCWFRLVD